MCYVYPHNISNKIEKYKEKHALKFSSNSKSEV